MMRSSAAPRAVAVSVECRYSYDDLFRAATGREMSDTEASGFSTLSQGEKNRVVRDLVRESDGEYACADRLGSDGVTYTAFWRAADLAPGTRGNPPQP